MAGQQRSKPHPPDGPENKNQLEPGDKVPQDGRYAGRDSREHTVTTRTFTIKERFPKVSDAPKGVTHWVLIRAKHGGQNKHAADAVAHEDGYGDEPSAD